jgi:transposase
MHKDESEHHHHPMKKLKSKTLPEMKNTATYVGMDIAKATLQVHLNGHQIEFQNNPIGHDLLSQKLARLNLPHVVCEATGGYERPVVQALQQAKIAVSVVNPAFILSASQAKGKRAKTDRCDAQALTDYGQRYNPEPTPAVAAELREINALTVWLKQLIENRALAKTQAEHHSDPFVRRQHEQLLAHYEEQIETTEQEIKKRVQSQKQFQDRLDCLIKIQGVGFRTALMALVFMPELGAMNRGQTRCPRRPGPLDAGKRPHERQELHQRRPRANPPHSLHVRLERNSNQPHPDGVLRLAEKTKQTRQSCSHRGDAKDDHLHESPA